MEQVIQVTGLCVVGALLALVVKRGSPETALLLAVGAAVVVALALAGVVKELLASVVETAGTLCALLAALPLLRAVLDMLLELMG